MKYGLLFALLISNSSIAADRDFCSAAVIAFQGSDPFLARMTLDRGIRVVPITGELTLPTPYVLMNLGLPDLIDENLLRFYKTQTSIPSPWQPTERSLVGEIAISIGEGFGGLVVYLRSLGIKAYGVDPVYGRKISENVGVREMLLRFQENWRDYLIQSTASDLSMFADDSVALVVGHQVASWLDNKLDDSLIEALRVLKPGGTLRMNTVSFLQQNGRLEALKRKLTAAGYTFEIQIVSGSTDIGLVNQMGTFRLLTFSEADWDEIDPGFRLLQGLDENFPYTGKDHSLLLIRKL